jgi:aminoglycoside phosphotransferase (APT) family kinase protein
MTDLLDLEGIEALLDQHGLGRGPIRAQRVGGGLSHLTFRLEREGAVVILRRPPRPPLAHGAHDVIREAKLLTVVHAHGVRAPRVLLMHEDTKLLGVPFYVMEAVNGHVLTDDAPPDVWARISPPEMIEDFVRGLVEIHAVPVGALEFIRRPKRESFVDRQLTRWLRTWEQVKWRTVPEIDRVGNWLQENRPADGEETLVHGDYRLANLMFGGHPDVRLVSVLDWEMASLGNPIFDLAYLLTFYPRPRDEAGLLLGKAWFATKEGYPSRRRLIELYTQMSGREATDLTWHMACTIWRTAIGVEALYGRERSGTSDIAGQTDLKDEVLVLGRRMAAVIDGELDMS